MPHPPKRVSNRPEHPLRLPVHLAALALRPPSNPGHDDLSARCVQRSAQVPCPSRIIYCDYYVYWKDEGKNWDANLGEDQLWNYNCQDCVYTYEVADTLRSIVEKMELGPVNTAQQQMFWPVLKAMQLGIRVDTAKRSELTAEVQEEIAKREQFIYDTLGHDFNVNSHVQMKKLFYDDLKLPVQMTRAKKGVAGHATLNDEAMQRL